jgi:di/tricarboxylate transporter
MIDFQQILVFIVILFILVSLYLELLGPAFTFLIAIITLGIFGVLTPMEMISGLANVQIVVIIMLLLFGDIIRKTSIIENIFDRFFRSARSFKGFLSRMMLLVATFSAFLNNTPLVAIMIPYVHNWCKRKNYYPSKFLIPLSYAAILGGSVTLIGTSTNLIVNGMIEDNTIIPDLRSLEIFDFVYVGVPMVIIGFLYLLIFGNKFLPNKATITESYSRHSRQYVIEAKVRANSHLIGRTVKEAGLIDLKGLYLVEIMRRSFRISAVSPEVILDRGDVLVFAGETDRIAELIESNSGLILPEVGMLMKKKKTEIVEVVVSQNSYLINKSVRGTDFRGKYDAAILAVHRNGERIRGKLGSVILKAGDVLLLYTGGDFLSRTINTREFYFISKVRDFVKLEWYKSFILIGGLFLSITLSALHIVPLFMGLIILIVAAMALGVTRPKELPQSIDYNLALIIVLALALGTAMIKSGTADLIANLLINIFVPFGKIWLLLAIYFITAILAAYVTNKAAVAVIFPIALTAARILDISAIPFVLTVAYAAAANFMTPIGYQTNLMVYGPGGYSFKDFFKIGFPLTMIYMVVTVTILSLMYF